jgi:ferrous iron transport protein A
MKTKPLTKLRAGEKSVVMEITGGRGLTNRLSALGIIPGKEITKINAMVMRGPVVIRFGNTQVALGYDMASKIQVRV